MSSEDRQSDDDPEAGSTTTDGTTDSTGDRRSTGTDGSTGDSDAPSGDGNSSGGDGNAPSGDGNSSGGDGNAPSGDELGDGEPETPPITANGSEAERPVWKRLLSANDGPLLFMRELLLSLSIVAVIGLVLFAVSGVWPPMVAVESNSMEPHISKYDLVFVTDTGRYAPANSNEQGLVMAETGDESHVSFGRTGSVIVYDVPGTPGSPIIHRARFAVDEGENWYDEANPEAISAESCEELSHCPAEYAGYITKGDNNAQYDQANGIAPIVRPQWVEGVARARVPYLGRLRLALLGTASNGLQMPTGVGTVQMPTGVGTVVQSSAAVAG